MEKKILLIGKKVRLKEEIITKLKTLGYFNAKFLEQENLNEVLNELREGFVPDVTVLDVNGYGEEGIGLLTYLSRLNNGSLDTLIMTEENVELLEKTISEKVGKKLPVYSNLNLYFFYEDIDRILKSNMRNKGRISVVGMGRIGEALLNNLVSSKELNLKEVTLYCRDKDKEKRRIEGIVKQTKVDSDIPIFINNNLESIGKNSELVVLAIGGKESNIKRREDIGSVYFDDIRYIMMGLGETEAKSLITTNQVTLNCSIAHAYSKQKHPDKNIFGFTRLDYLRGVDILFNWLRDEHWTINRKDIEVDVLGPHGKGLLVTNIRIAKKPAIFDNLPDEIPFKKKHKTISNLSRKVSEYGEIINRMTKPEGNASYFATKILETIKNITLGGKDTVAVNIDLENICKSGLNGKDYRNVPVYLSFPVDFCSDVPILHKDIINKIPGKQRVRLLNVILSEGRIIRKYLEENKDGLRPEYI